MKTRNFILAALFILTLGNASIYAADSKLRSEAINELEYELRSQMQKVCLDGIMEREECEITLIFSIDDHQLTDILVQGDNNELVRRVGNKLQQNTIFTDPLLDNRKYKVTVSFKDGLGL